MDTLFLILGIILLIIGILLMIAFISSLVKCNKMIKATVSKVDCKSRFWRGKTLKNITPTFTYSYQDKKYTSKAAYSTCKEDKFIIGKESTIYINPKNPSICRYGKNVNQLIIALAFLLIGLILTLCFFL